eukprot:g67075.t1
MDVKRLNDIKALLYADDVALIAHSRTELQKMVNVVAKFAEDYRLEVNLKPGKTEIMPIYTSSKAKRPSIREQGEIQARYRLMCWNQLVGAKLKYAFDVWRAPGLVVWSQQAVQPVREGGGEADGRLAELLAVIPEGACCPEAVSGALSLAADLEKQLGLGAASSSSSSSSSSCSSQHATAHSHIPRFDHIFMDSGTGLTAAATIWAFRWLQGQSQANITLPHLHVMLNAGNTESFHQRLQEVQGWLPAWMRSDLLPANNHMSAAASFTLHAPSVGKSFGSAPSATLREVRRLVSEHGVWTEPVYSGKLFADGLRLVSQLAQKDMPAQAVAQTAETERELQDSERTHRSNLHRQCAGSAEPLNALFIHSGGVQSIFGFQHKLDRQQ